MCAVDAVVRSRVSERLARPQPGHDLEPFVEHRGVHLHVGRLAEGAVLLVGREPEAHTEHRAASAQMIEGDDVLREHMRPATRHRRDEGSETQTPGAHRTRAEDHPRIVDVEVELASQVQVIPEEEAVPSRAFGDGRELDERPGVTDVRHADRKAHRAVSTPSVISLPAGSLKRMYVDVTDATFQTEVIERSSSVPVVMDLWAPWCGPCRTLGPIIEKVIDEADGKVALVKVNVDENPQISRAFQVQSIPLVIGLKDGQPIDAFLGAQPEAAVRDFVLGLLPTEQETAIDALVAAGDEASLRQALELDAGNELAVVALAELLVEKGETEEALALLARIPENAETRRVAALARLGDDAPATDDLDEKLNALLDRVKDDDAARQEYVDLLEVMGADDPRTAGYRKALTARLF